MDPLPPFRYHPDPIASGSVEPSKRQCRCCGKKRGCIYTGPAYCEEDLEDALCPWCIASGAAHEKFGAEFVDLASLDLPEKAAQEIAQRTPGFSTWQGEAWPVCCGDATAFLSAAGFAQVRTVMRELEPEILKYLSAELTIPSNAAEEVFQTLSREQGPTLYVFRCLSCEKHRYHVDFP